MVLIQSTCFCHLFEFVVNFYEEVLNFFKNEKDIQIAIKKLSEILREKDFTHVHDQIFNFKGKKFVYDGGVIFTENADVINPLKGDISVMVWITDIVN